ncbi:hypothetical protein IWQ62_004586 [Dispira parvispora]|uniref:BZIP domain-containing protein n=1 Tax=Dispira parvispora TaxID=1520584 RepID=A0A9W8ARK4_9FUNG|nr:hypothetical protein IWQ62_004586 [Dispira parvispora]
MTGHSNEPSAAHAASPSLTTGCEVPADTHDLPRFLRHGRMLPPLRQYQEPLGHLTTRDTISPDIFIQPPPRITTVIPGQAPDYSTHRKVQPLASSTLATLGPGPHHPNYSPVAPLTPHPNGTISSVSLASHRPDGPVTHIIPSPSHPVYPTQPLQSRSSGVLPYSERIGPPTNPAVGPEAATVFDPPVPFSPTSNPIATTSASKSLTKTNTSTGPPPAARAKLAQKPLSHGSFRYYSEMDPIPPDPEELRRKAERRREQNKNASKQFRERKKNQLLRQKQELAELQAKVQFYSELLAKPSGSTMGAASHPQSQLNCPPVTGSGGTPAEDMSSAPPTSGPEAMDTDTGGEAIGRGGPTPQSGQLLAIYPDPLTMTPEEVHKEIEMLKRVNPELSAMKTGVEQQVEQLRKKLEALPADPNPLPQILTAPLSSGSSSTSNHPEGRLPANKGKQPQL